MKRVPASVRPGSQSLGRSLVMSAEYRDLIARHAAVSELIARTKQDIEVVAGMAANAEPSTARRLQFQLAGKRKFLDMVQQRQLVLAAQLTRYEEEDKRLLAELLNPGSN